MSVQTSAACTGTGITVNRLRIITNDNSILTVFAADFLSSFINTTS